MKKAAAILILAAIAVALYLLTLWWPQETVVPEAAVTETEEVIKLRFGHNIPTNSAMHQAALRFADDVRKRSNDKVLISIHPNQELGNDHQMVEMARAGELDILLTPTAKMSVPVPAIQYADLPFLFPSRDDAYAMLDGDPGRMLLAKLADIGLVGVTFWENGFKQFTANKPLTLPDDFEGLKIRVMKSRIIMDQFKAFGATPIPIDFHATRKALADGVVDGQENPLVAIVSMGFHEVQSHMTLSNHAYLGYVLSFSAKVFDGLPGNVQKLLMNAARQTTPWERHETQRREAEFLATVREAGVQIHELDPDARLQFAERTRAIADRYEEIIGAEIMAKTTELLYERRRGKQGEKPPIILGVDADLSMDTRSSGIAILRGARIAIAEINAAGGLLGHPLALLPRDHKGQSRQAKENIRRFAADPNVVAVLAGQSSTVIAPVLEDLHQAGLLLLAPWSSNPSVVENGYQPNYVFRASANDRMAAPFIIDHVLKAYRSPAILFENSLWGRTNKDLMQQRLKQQSRSFVSVASFNRGSTDFSRDIRQIQDASADSIVIIAKPLEGRTIIRQLAALVDPLPVFSHWGILGNGDFWADNRKALEKVDLCFFQTYSFLDAPNDTALRLQQAYLDHLQMESPRQIMAPNGVAQSYDLVHLLALAIEQAGNTDRTRVRDALEQLPPYNGAVKRYAPAFTPTRHDALDSTDYRLACFGKDGAIEPLPL